MSVLVSTAMLLSCLSGQAGKIPVIIDTDIGDDIDDTWALAMALGMPELDLKLIVTSSDDTPTRTRLVAKMLHEVGRTDIPIGTGVKTSDRAIKQGEWLGDYDLKGYEGTVHEDGVQALIDCIKASPQPVTLVVIGPQTNIKAALDRDPSIAENARVVAMAGSIDTGYLGMKGAVPEYNVWRDQEAAKAVFAAPWDITMAPLDICGTFAIKGERYAKVEAAKAARARMTIENCRTWEEIGRVPEGSSSILYDTVAIYLALQDDLCEMETLKLSIGEKGKTVRDEKGRKVQCALGWKDREAFEDLLVRKLTEEQP